MHGGSKKRIFIAEKYNFKISIALYANIQINVTRHIAKMDMNY